MTVWIHLRASARIAAWMVVMMMGGSAELLAQSSISLTGWNYDVIYENDGSPSITNSVDPSGYTFVEDGLTIGYSLAGLPSSGNVTSLASNVVTGGHTSFELQSFTANNAALMIGSSSVTLSLATPAAFSSLALLHMSAEGAPSQTITVTLTFSDNSTGSFAYSSKDWKHDPAWGYPNPGDLPPDAAIARKDRVKYNPSNGGLFVDADHPWWVMFESDVNLTSMGFDNKAIQSITLANLTPSYFYTNAAVFGVSGSFLGNRNDFFQGTDLSNSLNYQLNANTSIHRLPTANSDDVLLATGTGDTLTINNNPSLTMGSLNVANSTAYIIQNETAATTSNLTLGTSSNSISTSRNDLIYLGPSSNGLTIRGTSPTGGTLNVALTRTGNFNVANPSGLLDISAAISGTGFGISTTGPGTVKLSGDNTFSGTTTVNAGELNAAANGALGNTSGIVIANGGTLLLSGTDVNRVNDTASVSITSGGVLKFGDSNSDTSETLGALTLSPGSILDFGPTLGDFAATFASLILPDTGYATIVNWNGQVSQGFGQNTDRLLFSSIPGATSADAIRFYINGTLHSAQFLQLNGTGPYELLPNQTLAAVPEPTTLLAGAVLFSLSIVGRQMRSRYTP